MERHALPSGWLTSQQQIDDNYLDNTADVESDAMWAEIDALEVALV